MIFSCICKPKSTYVLLPKTACTHDMSKTAFVIICRSWEDERRKVKTSMLQMLFMHPKAKKLHFLKSIYKIKEIVLVLFLHAGLHFYTVK
jgi:hypothetical protein